MSMVYFHIEAFSSDKMNRSLKLVEISSGPKRPAVITCVLNVFHAVMKCMCSRWFSEVFLSICIDFLPINHVCL